MLSIRQFASDLFRFKKSLILAIILFSVGVYLGTVNTEMLQKIIEPQIEQLGKISNRLQQTSNQELNLFWFIFINNSIKSVLIIPLGILLGIIPCLFLVLNGMAIGYVVNAAVLNGSEPMGLIVKGLLPHGIIEIPAILIACAFGLHLGALAWRSLAMRKGGLKGEGRAILRSMVRASFWIVILLLVAAGIESTITFHLMTS